MATWTAALNRLKVRPLSADKPRYLALQAIAAPTSPLKQIIESIRDETRLTRERPASAARPSGPGGGSAAVDPTTGRVKAVLAEAGLRQAQSAVSQVLSGTASTAVNALTRIGVESALNRRPGGAQGGAPVAPDRLTLPTNEAPGTAVEAQFRAFHALLDGDVGRRTVDTLVQNLNELKNAALEATNPSQAAVANNNIVTQTGNLRSLASRFPPPFEGMIRQISNEFAGNAAGAAVSQIQQMLGDQVIRDCQQIVTNRYPFSKGSDREIPVADFARFFGPNGIMDKFFQQNLASRADRSKAQWTWRADDPIARSLSAASLREFQRAGEIRDAFFSTGGNMPSVTMAVTPLTLSGDAARAKLDINGTGVVTQGGISMPSTVQWPGPGGLGRTAITIETGGGGGGGFFGGSAPTVSTLLEKTGTWSLYRLLDTGSVLKQGDAVVATFVAGGRELSYRFNVSTIVNPLVLPALREFKCPSGI